MGKMVRRPTGAAGAARKQPGSTEQPKSSSEALGGALERSGTVAAVFEVLVTEPWFF